MLYFFCLRFLTPFAKNLFPFHVKGIEHIPKDGELIVCCNHRSVIDPFLLAIPFQRQIRYMAKSELFEEHGAFVRRMLYKFGAFPVKRGKGDAESIKTAMHIINSGGILGIFPQGKCVYDSTPFKAKAGVALLAAKTHAPILPASIYCDGRIKPFRRITLRFGPVIPYEELNITENEHASIREAAGIISQRINELLEEKD